MESFDRKANSINHSLVNTINHCDSNAPDKLHNSSKSSGVHKRFTNISKFEAGISAVTWLIWKWGTDLIPIYDHHHFISFCYDLVKYHSKKNLWKLQKLGWHSLRMFQQTKPQTGLKSNPVLALPVAWNGEPFRQRVIFRSCKPNHLRWTMSHDVYLFEIPIATKSQCEILSQNHVWPVKVPVCLFKFVRHVYFLNIHRTYCILLHCIWSMRLQCGAKFMMPALTGQVSCVIEIISRVEEFRGETWWTHH